MFSFKGVDISVTEGLVFPETTYSVMRQGGVVYKASCVLGVAYATGPQAALDLVQALIERAQTSAGL